MESKEPLYCSFCRKDQTQVSKLVAGPGVCICDACVTLCLRVMKGKRTPGFAGWETLTDEQILGTLPAASSALKATEQKLREHVALLRARNVSWDRIGAALGVSRQSAWERFADKSE